MTPMIPAEQLRQAQQAEHHALAVYHFEQARVARLCRDLTDAQRELGRAEGNYQATRRAVERLIKP